MSRKTIAESSQGQGLADFSDQTTGQSRVPHPRAQPSLDDRHSRSVVDWATDEYLPIYPVESVLATAARRTRRAGDLHADRGSRYTGQLVRIVRIVRKRNLLLSVGRTGACHDNAAAEPLWATLKVEFCDH